MAILDEHTLDFTSTGIEQTHRLGIRLGELLEKGDMICLSGDLGSGKTALARGIARGWGTTHRVTSPTFTLVNEYPRLGDNCVLFHIDCYRLSSPADIVTAGLEDILDDGGAIMIEWPERILDLLPDDRLWVSLRYMTETRRGLRFQAFGSRPEVLLKEFRQSAFGV